MRRTKAPGKVKDDDELAPLLARRNSDSDNEGSESIELTNFNARRRRKNDGHESPSLTHPRQAAKVEEEPQFVWHELESHHTIQGIALQYRVSIESIMRMNKLKTIQEMHIEKRLKIPAKTHGALLHNPEEFRSADAGTNKLYTTAIPQARSELDLNSATQTGHEDGTKLVTHEEEMEENAPRPSAASFLNTFDNQMESAIKAMDTTLKKQATTDDSTDTLIYARNVRQSSQWDLNFQVRDHDWRVASLALAVVLLISFSTVYLFKFVSAPLPHRP
eukprot:m.171748 g.171748  ORF g.171748 m.171748 type:complete len:276 (-) comp31661_c0_seq2:53-880(-)